MSHETTPLVIDIPDAIREARAWLVWDERVKPDGEHFKYPMQPSGRPFSSVDRFTWHTYGEAAASAGQYKGLGIAFGRQPGSDGDWAIWGIDLDGCVTPDGITDEALKVLARADSYAEFSPSGTGIHILLLGDAEIVPSVKISTGPHAGVELYSNGRFFTFSGNHVPGTPTDLQPRAGIFKALRAELDLLRPSPQRRSVRRASEKPATTGKDPKQSVRLTDAELLDRAQAGPSGEAFKALYEGDMSAYREDHSSADLALCGRLAFWTGKDVEQIDRIFRTSQLMRPKWDTRRGLGTYGEQTIEMAVENCDETYSGPDTSSISFVENLKAKRAAKVAKTQKVGDTVTLGHVRDQERGDDKPAHGKRINDQSPNLLNKSAQKLSKLISDSETGEVATSTGTLKPGERLSPLGSRVISAFEHHTLWPGESHGEMESGLFEDVDDASKIPQADLFGARFTTGLKVTLSRQTIEDSTPGGKPVPMVGDSHKVYESRTIAKTDAMCGQPGCPNRAVYNAKKPRHPLCHTHAWRLANGKDMDAPIDHHGTEPYINPDGSSIVDLRPSVIAVEPNEVTIPEGAKYPDPDDIGNADRLVLRYKGRLLWSPGSGWMWWDGKRWAIGDQYAHLAGQETARSIMQEAIDPRLSPDAQKGLFKHYHDTAALGKRNSMLETASVRPEFHIEQKLLDAQAMFLNVINGTLNLETGELMEHDPEMRITKLAPVNWNPDARSALWEEFLAKATIGQDGLAEFLQRAVGYTLTGKTLDDVFFVVKGNAGTGKTTFTGSIRNMMGDYATTMRSEVITDKLGGGSSGHQEEIAVLAGRRLILSSETNASDSIKEGLVKGLTGKEEITASRKYGHQMTFNPQFKLWLAANDMPKMRSDDTGMWRRIHKLTFEHKFDPADPRVREALLYDLHHREAILAWAVRGTREWLRIGLKPPQSVVDATEQLRQSTDRLADYFEDTCYFNPTGGLWVSSKELSESYWRWANDNNVPEKFRPSLRGDTFKNALAHRGAVAKKAHGERGWAGLILKPEEEQA
jgi:putative DNA primase/helicase